MNIYLAAYQWKIDLIGWHDFNESLEVNFVLYISSNKNNVAFTINE